MRRATINVFVVLCLAAGPLLGSFAFTAADLPISTAGQFRGTVGGLHPSAAWISSPLPRYAHSIQADAPAALTAPLRRRAVRHPSIDVPPAAVPDSYSTQGTPLGVPAPGVLTNDTLNGATIASYGASTGSEQTSIGASAATAQGGTISLNADGSFNYNPVANFTGIDTFKYVLTNSAGRSTAAVTLTVIATPPVASPDSYTTPRSTPLSVPAPGVLANDTLNGATIASYGALTGTEQTSIGASTTTAQGGLVNLNADGSFSYNPVANFTGNDTFKYVIQNTGGSSTATVTIAVQAPAGPDFTVTSPGFFYSITGLSGQNPVLTLTRGRTYTFQINTSSIHPFEILNAPAGSVTNNNISNGTLTFRVPMAAQNYAYQCSIHFFGGTIQTVP